MTHRGTVECAGFPIRCCSSDIKAPLVLFQSEFDGEFGVIMLFNFCTNIGGAAVAYFGSEERHNAAVVAGILGRRCGKC
jgi:hypothetical protein